MLRLKDIRKYLSYTEARLYIERAKLTQASHTTKWSPRAEALLIGTTK